MSSRDYWREHKRHKEDEKSSMKSRIRNNKPKRGYKIVKCDGCNGSGVVGYWAESRDCSSCFGMGKVEVKI